MIRLVYLLCILLVSGCSTFSFTRSADRTSINSLLNENNFAAAFELLEAASPAYKKSGEYTSLYNQVNSKATAYESNVLEKVHLEANKKNYAVSLQLLDEAIINYPQSNKLAEERKVIDRNFRH